MALERIDYPANLTDQDDFSAHGDLIEVGYFDKVSSPILARGGNIPQGVVLQIGSVVFHGVSDTAISGSASDYVQVTDNEDGTASAAYVANLTGVQWVPQYNGYYDTATPARLYIFDEGKALAAGAIAAVFGRYLMQQANGDVAVGRDLAVKRDLAVGRNQTVGGTLGVTGHTTASTLGVTGALSAATANARGFDTFGGFHRGTGRDDTNLPVGSVVLALRLTGDPLPNRNVATNVYLGSVTNYDYRLGPGGSQLSGTWRARGGIASGSDAYYLMQRTA